MIDIFVILTPVLLLGIIALLGFVGCDRVFTIAPVPSAVLHVQTVVKSAAAGTDTIIADPLTLQGGELVVATLQWRSGSVVQPVPTLSGAAFLPIVGGGPFDWNGMRIQTFVATNPGGNPSLTIQATVPGGSNLTWHLCVSAYSGFDANAPVYSPQQNGPAYFGTNPQAPPINTGNGDIVYAVAFAADNNGTFPGNNSLSPGPSFTAEFPAIGNPLVEDIVNPSPITAQATITSQAPNPRGFIFALGIKTSGA